MLQNLIYNEHILSILLIINLYITFEYRTNNINNSMIRSVFLSVIIVMTSRYLQGNGYLNLLFIAVMFLTAINIFVRGMLIVLEIMDWFQNLDKELGKSSIAILILIGIVFIALIIIKHSVTFALHNKGGISP